MVRLAPCRCGHPGAGCYCFDERLAEARFYRDVEQVFLAVAVQRGMTDEEILTNTKIDISKNGVRYHLTSQGLIVKTDGRWYLSARGKIKYTAMITRNEDW